VAIALMAARNLTKDEYAANHPAGKIGKSLIFKVRISLFYTIFLFYEQIAITESPILLLWIAV
jgi:hypothetical protein